LTANISGKHKNNNKWQTSLSTAIYPPWTKKIGELWSTNKKVTAAHVDLP